ncbi:hypothetical protein RCH06_001264 [Polaromonas sp. CG_9.5]|uniref:hypothetical protein n=1 Tax=Polaromonas sp. CG_9.5 TaxID=3071705 RepID=UPI002E052665|nr:hypothetical protein [Polaromonas sp. CG_9.5]
MTAPNPKPKARPKPKNKPLKPESEAPVAAGGTGLRVGGAQAQTLSAAQKRFNKLLDSIDTFKAQIAEAQRLVDTYRVLYSDTLTPLQAQNSAAMRRMALLLDERLQRKGLSAAQKKSLIEILCGLCELLAASGDEEMTALHDKHSPQSLREIKEAESARIRNMMKNALGDRLDVDLEDESLDPMARLEALLSAAKAQQADEEEQAQRRHAAKASKKPPTAAQRKTGQQQEDAKLVLRQVYRQLASALHPDREKDPAEHQRKTALMSQANAAYAQQDLVTLLHIQQRIEQLEPGAISEMPEARIAAMTTLLKQQAAELEDELFGRQEQLRQAFNLNYFEKPTDASLQRNLALEAEALEETRLQMEEDLQMVQDDAGLKRWLKFQKQLARQMSFY